MAWADAAGTPLTGSVGTEPRYFHTDGSLWLLEPETGTVSVLRFARMVWEAPACTGTAYIIGNGPLAAPRETFSIEGVAGVWVRDDDAASLILTAQSAMSGAGCIAFASSNDRAIPATAATAVTVPSLGVTPPLHPVLTGAP